MRPDHDLLRAAFWRPLQIRLITDPRSEPLCFAMPFALGDLQMSGIDLPNEWRDQIVSWARDTSAVDELWLFGSRAKGTSRPDSDVDIAVSLMPAKRNNDWALGDYLALSQIWQRRLKTIVGRHVSLTAIVPNTPADTEVRSTGVMLWCRTK
jgi:predicted nucleotidyltransferase